MRLNLKPIIHASGESLPFEFSLDLHDVELSGQAPVSAPVMVAGRVRNQAGMLLLDGRMQTTLTPTCDRCGKHFSREKHLPLSFVLAEEIAGEDNDEIILLDAGELDIGELAYTTFILEMDTKHLCLETCKGLCPGCGADLNEEACHCKPAVDPRWSALSQLLE